jgi:hypothetical protein
MALELPGSPSAWAKAAVDRIRHTPLRWSDGDPGRSAEEIDGSGFFLGGEESGRALADGSGAEVRPAIAFAGRWPILEAGDWRVAPAVPAAISRVPVEGPDGFYRGTEGAVLREAGGTERAVVSLDLDASTGDTSFDLLWFGESERFLLRGDTIEIEDLFSITSLPASSVLLDRLVVRARRASTEVVVGLPSAAGRRVSEVQVARPLALMGESLRWSDPAAFLGVRADVLSAAIVGGRAEARTVDERRVVFSVDEHTNGWRLQVIDGRYPLQAIALTARHKSVNLVVELAEGVDPLVPGMRGRLAFDLQSDLVAMAGRSEQRRSGGKPAGNPTG